METMSPVTCYVYSTEIEDGYVQIETVGRSTQIMVVPLVDWAEFREVVNSIEYKRVTDEGWDCGEVQG